MSLRLGAVAFLNGRPLVASLEADPRFAVSFSVPSACARQLRTGAIELGQIPSIDYARSPEPYCILPQVAIGSRGDVLTVRLYHTCPPAQLRRVALDLSSLTSVALVRILLAECFAVTPEFVDAEPNLDAMLGRADGALLIGDSVFANLDTKTASLDLGRLWSDLTGLPFVYAFWAGRCGALTGAEAAALVCAARDGEGEIPRIAAEQAADEATARLYEEYLTSNISYALGQEEIAGLNRFYGLAEDHGLIGAVPPLRFFPAE